MTKKEIEGLAKDCDWICTLPLHELITAGVEIGNDAKS